MGRRLFRKALNHIESRSCDSNISRLNDELKKTGMLSERMTTSTVIPPTVTQPFIPPTSSPAPLGDLSDLDTFAWDNAAQGDGSSISHDFSQLATTDVNGETKPILEIPSISTTDGTGFTGTVYGLAFGVNTAVTGTPLGYINGNGFNHVYQINNVFSVTHSQFSRALVDYYEANTFVQKPIYLWTSLRYRGGQLVTPVQTSSDGNKGLYGHSLLIPVDSNGNVKRNNIITDLGQPRTIVLNRLDDPSAPDYYEGDFSRFLANLLNVGKQAFDYLVGASDDFLSAPSLPDIPALDYSSEIAQSIITNKPIDVPQSEIPKEDIEKLANAIPPKLIGSDQIPVTDTPIPYSDDNFYEDENGNVNAHTAETKRKYPNNTSGAASGNRGFMGFDNPLGSAGQAQTQVVVPSDGSEPYLLWTDHAYHNLKSDDPGEVPDIIKQALSSAVHNLSGKGDPNKPNTGEMSSYPPNIKGDVRKQVKIPVKDLSPEQQDAVNIELEYQKAVKDGKIERIQEGKVLSEGWQSPDHTNVEKDSKTRWFNPNAGTDSAKWFDPKEVKPAYPAKAPPKMIDGYSATSNLAPKSVEKSPAIKLTKKDLLRNHRLKDSEVKDMMQTIDRINKFIAAHPEELIYAKSRYPKHDPRLAELNWNMDQMLKASGDYLDKQFPENERLFDKVKSATKRSIDLTDPETYKKDPGDLSSIGNLARVDHVMNYYEPKDRTVSKIKMENRKSVNRFFEKPKRPDRPAFLRKKK